MLRRDLLRGAAAGALLAALPRSMRAAGNPPPAVATQAFNNARTGANLAETTLSAEAVARRGISRLFSCAMPGDARGSEGMTLRVPGLTMADGAVHDAIFQCDMADQVWAWDGNTGQLLWQQRIGTPVANTRALDMYLINDHWGVLSTPVIDVTAGILYAVSLNSTDGTIATAGFRLVGLHLRDGSAAFAPVSLEGATYQPPAAGLEPVSFRTVARKQRAGLLLTRVGGVATVFIGCGSFNEDEQNLGWVIAVDVTAASAPRIAAAWASCPRYGGGGIWMAGGGLVADAAGHVFLMTGNGAFDGLTDFGESFVKLGYTPAASGVAAALTVLDWFTPFTDSGRVGGDPTLADISLVPGYTAGRDLQGNTANMNGFQDQDLGSGAPVLIEASLSGFSRDILLGAGKDGIVYVLDAGNMGRTQLADFAPDRIQAGVYGKALQRPIWFTYYNPTLDPAPTNLYTLNVKFGGRTHHQHSRPVALKTAEFGMMIYGQGENGTLRAWRLAGDGTLTFMAEGNEVASGDVPVPGGMPGGMLTASSNAGAAGSAVVWCVIPYGDANKTITAGRLLAYHATQFDTAADGSKKMRVLWDSQQWALGFDECKFNVPSAMAGYLHCPTYDGRVDVYGLA